jgi:hypothetical protein
VSDLTLGPELFALLNERQWVGNQQPVIYGDGGLSLIEIENIEVGLGFPLPPDFRYFLQNFRDDGGVLFPWKNFDKQKYDQKIQWVWEGIAFDIENNAEWMEDRWGFRPKSPAERLAIARKDFEDWPRLLPVCAHRFLAADPCMDDNPVFSIMQTDIIYYGANLAHYLVNEFIDQDYTLHVNKPNIRHIPVWSDFVR